VSLSSPPTRTTTCFESAPVEPSADVYLLPGYSLTVPQPYNRSIPNTVTVPKIADRPARFFPTPEQLLYRRNHDSTLQPDICPLRSSDYTVLYRRGFYRPIPCAVPSGASTGIHEAVELRDGDKSQYVGKGTCLYSSACEWCCIIILLDSHLPTIPLSTFSCRILPDPCATTHWLTSPGVSKGCCKRQRNHRPQAYRVRPQGHPAKGY
jgi:hypothetical protein